MHCGHIPVFCEWHAISGVSNQGGTHCLQWRPEVRIEKWCISLPSTFANKWSSWHNFHIFNALCLAFILVIRRPASRSCLFTVDVGVLRVLFNEAASWRLVRHLFLKLDTNVLVLLLSCASGPPTPLSILIRASLHCSVKGVVYRVVRDLQFLGNFLHGIALISQNMNRLTSFRRNVFVSGHYEPVIEPTNADASDTQLV
jgi:hypothetical protein